MTPAPRRAGTGRGRALRLTRRLIWRLLVLGVAFVVLAVVLFGPQLVTFWLSLKPVGIAVHNATGAPLTVSTVDARGERSFFLVAASETRLIPDGRDQLITILDRECRIRDARQRGHQPPEFMIGEVTAAGTTWLVVEPPPPGLVPAGPAAPCEVQ